MRRAELERQPAAGAVIDSDDLEVAGVEVDEGAVTGEREVGFGGEDAGREVDANAPVEVTNARLRVVEDGVRIGARHGDSVARGGPSR